MTREGVERLRHELAELTGVRRTAAIQMIADSRGAGDLSENGDYQVAIEVQGQIEGRIKQLEMLLARVEIVEHPVDTQVGIGTLVTVDFGGGDTDSYLYVSIDEKADGHSCLSPESPLGKALYGARVGDVVRAETPAGAVTVTVTGISVP